MELCTYIFQTLEHFSIIFQDKVKELITGNMAERGFFTTKNLPWNFMNYLKQRIFLLRKKLNVSDLFHIKIFYNIKYRHYLYLILQYKAQRHFLERESINLNIFSVNIFLTILTSSKIKKNMWRVNFSACFHNYILRHYLNLHGLILLIN